MTIMDRGLRERRAQIRAQKRAERLEAREKRTRSVRKAYDDPTADEMYGGEYTGKTSDERMKELARRRVFNFKDIYKHKDDKKKEIQDWHEARGVKGPYAASNTTSESTSPSGTTTHRADTSDIAQDIDADNYREALGHSTETGTTNSNRQRLLTSIGRTSTFEDSSGEVPKEDSKESAESEESSDTDYVYDHSMTMAENVVAMEERRANEEFQDNLDNGMPLKEAATIYNDRVDAARGRAAGESVSDDAQDDLGTQDGPNTDADTNTNTVTDTTSDDAYAKEMEQTKYNIMRDNAGKFLTAMAGTAVDNLDKINTAGWDMAGNMVKAMFTRPEALSSASRVIGSAMSMNEAVGRMAEDTSKRYGIAVQADPELIKDTIKYKAYKRAKDIDGKVMGNAMKALDDSLRALGVEDISQLDESQLVSYRSNVEGEMEHIRELLQKDQNVRKEAREGGLLAEIKSGLMGLRGDFRKNKYNYNRPDWNGRLHSDDRTMLMRTYDILTDHVKELDKHANQLSKEEKARVMEARRKDKESRMRAYATSPIGFVLKELSPEFRLEVGQDGLPRNLRDYSRVENMIARMEADDRAAYGDDDTLWRHTAQEYQAARDLMKKSRDDIFNTKNAIAIEAYESSPYNWALIAAFPNYNVPIDENTGLPTDMRHVNKIRQTVEVLKKQDSLKPNPIRSSSVYDAMLRSIDAYKENVRKQGNISKLQSYGGEAVSLSDNVPTLTRDASIIDSTGYWGASAKASMDYLWLRLGQLDAEIRAKGGNPADDPRYKHAYCMYSGAKYSRMMTGCANFISNIPITKLIRHGVDPSDRDADLNLLSQILKNSARKYFPLDEAKAAQLDLNSVYDRGKVIENIVRKMRQTYSFTKSNTTTSNAGSSTPASISTAPAGASTAPVGNPAGYVAPLKISSKFKRDTKEHAERSLKSMLKNDIAEFRNAFANLGNGGNAGKDFNEAYDKLTNLVRSSLDHDDPTSPIPDWYSQMDDMEKEAYVADLIDRWSYKNSRGNPLPRFPDTTGRSTFKDGDAEIEHVIDPASYKVGGSGVKNAWNKAFVEALYEKVNGEWVLRDPYVAGAYLLRLSHKSGQNPQSLKPVTYEEAVRWAQQYNEYIKESTSQSESGNEEENLLIIPTEEQKVTLSEEQVPHSEEQIPSTEEQQVTPNEASQIPSTEEQNVTPTEEQEVTPSEEQEVTPSEEQGSSNMGLTLTSENIGSVLEDLMKDSSKREILKKMLHIRSDNNKTEFSKSSKEDGGRFVLNDGMSAEGMGKILRDMGYTIKKPSGLFVKPSMMESYGESSIPSFTESLKHVIDQHEALNKGIKHANIRQSTEPRAMINSFIENGAFKDAHKAVTGHLQEGWDKNPKPGSKEEQWAKYFTNMKNLTNIIEDRMNQGDVSYPEYPENEREFHFKFKDPKSGVENDMSEKFLPPKPEIRSTSIPTTLTDLTKWAKNIVDAYASSYSSNNKDADVNRLIEIYRPLLQKFLEDDDRLGAMEEYKNQFNDWNVWDRFGSTKGQGNRTDWTDWEGMHRLASVDRVTKDIINKMDLAEKEDLERKRKALENTVRQNLRNYLVRLTRAVDDEQNPNANIDELVKHILSVYDISDIGQLTYKIPGKGDQLSVNLSTEDMDFEGSKRSGTRSKMNQLIKYAMYNELEKNMGEGTNVPSFAGAQLIPYLDIIEGAFGKDQNGVDIPITSNIYNLLRETIVPRASARKSRNPKRVKKNPIEETLTSEPEQILRSYQAEDSPDWAKKVFGELQSMGLIPGENNADDDPGEYYEGVYKIIQDAVKKQGGDGFLGFFNDHLNKMPEEDLKKFQKGIYEKNGINLANYLGELIKDVKSVYDDASKAREARIEQNNQSESSGQYKWLGDGFAELVEKAVENKRKMGITDRGLENERKAMEGRYQRLSNAIYNNIISKGGEDFLKYVEEDLKDPATRSIFLNKIASSDDPTTSRYVNDFLDGLMITFKMRKKGKSESKSES